VREGSCARLGIWSHADERRVSVPFTLPDLPDHRVHIGEVPDLGELAVFNVVKRELRSRHPTTARLNFTEDVPMSAGDREVHRDVVAVDNEMPYLPSASREMRRTEAGIAPQQRLDP